MLCQSCKKNNATIHFTKIINGNVEEIHICDICAKDNKDLDFEFPFGLSFQKIFTGLIGITDKEKENIKNIECLKCGLDYKKFMEIGKFGCSECYNTFKEDIESLLRGIHGHNEHKGKIPIKIRDITMQKRTIQSLREKLEESIVREDFEKAAYLRDEIKKIKSEIESFGE